MKNLNANGYQGQINSYDYTNKQLPIDINLFNVNNQYIERIGIFAPPGSKFEITQKYGTEMIEIGSTFMYEAYDTYITGIVYKGSAYNYQNGRISYKNYDDYDSELMYSLPATDKKRIIIDYIAMEK